jgi:general nucleoside transport system permease protein
MRLERRDRPSALALVLAPIGAVAATLVLSSLLVLWAGAPVARTFGAIVQGGFGSLFAWTETLTRAVPLILTGLAATVAFKARLYNIGAEGQLYGGAMAAVVMGSALVIEGAEGTPALALPSHLALVLVFAAAWLAGALLLIGPAWLKARLGVDEVVTTLLLNFVILLGVSALLDGPLKDPSAMGWPQSVPLPAELELTRLFSGHRLHSGLLIAAALAVALAIVLRHTVLGFAIRASGANAQAAAFAGVPALRTVLVVAVLSGGLAGLAGAIEVAGRTGYVTLDMSPGYGYSGIVIAMLAGLNPLAVLAASVFVAGMLVGADSMSRAVGVPTYIADFVVAASLISVLVATMLAQYRVRWSTGRSGRAA